MSRFDFMTNVNQIKSNNRDNVSDYLLNVAKNTPEVKWRQTKSQLTIFMKLI